MRQRVPVLLTVLLMACGPSDAQVVLRMTSWQSPAENALDLAAIGEFERANPGVRVENEPVTNQAEYREKVITSIVSGAPPDVFLMDNIDVPAFAEAGVVLDLRPFAGRVGQPLNAFYPNVLAIFSRGRELYAFPKGFSPLVYFYNRNLFDAAKLPYPRDGWTQDEFLQVARRLTLDLNGDGVIDQWGTAVDRRFFAWQAMIWSAGGDILTPDGLRASGALDSPQTLRALDFLTGLVVRHQVAPPPNALRAVTGNETRLFYSGRLALLASGHWLIPSVRSQITAGKLTLGVVSFPRTPGVPVATPLFASGWAVPRNAAHRKLAVQLAAALAGPAAIRQRLAGGLELAALSHVQSAFVARDSLGVSAAIARQVPSGRPPWGARIVRFREVEALLPEIIDRVIIQGQSVERATRDVAKRIDAVLVR